MWRCILCASWLVFASIESSYSASAADAPRPNIVLIVADDLGWADLGCYGADLHETPHLDRLATQGVRFTDAYAASVCSPTRAALLTGKHYARLHITIWREAAQKPVADRKLTPPVVEENLPYSEVTLAERLQAAGYLTAIVGKWHLGGADHYPETQGFDVNIGGTHWGAPFSYFYPYRGAGRFGGEFRYVPHLELGKAGEYLTDRLTDEALRVIDAAGEKPFFLYLAHHAVHTPIEAKPELTAKYQAKLAPALRHQNARYAAMLESLDQSVGRVLNRIDEEGLTDRTVVIFLSDNGGHVGEFDDMRCTNNTPLRSGKGSMYEGGVRVPLIVRAPGIAPGSCREPVVVMDLAPTISELAGVKVGPAAQAALDGVSLAPLLRDPQDALPRDALYFHYPHYYPTTTPAGAIRARDWKLVEYFEDGRQELYNLRDDLSEAHNLAAQEPETTRRLAKRLEAWRKSVAAQMPTNN